MDMNNTVEVYRQLEKEFINTDLHRPMHLERYEDGTVLQYDFIGVAQANRAKVRLEVDKFIGGGFAGQVYRVRILDIESEDGAIEGLKIGGIYAIKILIPPSNFSRLFRNVVYRIGFQGPFQPHPLDESFLARKAPDWLSLSRRVISVLPGEHQHAILEIDARGLDPGLHKQSLRLTSNDPHIPPRWLPVYLEILPKPDQEVERPGQGFFRKAGSPGDIFSSHTQIDFWVSKSNQKVLLNVFNTDGAVVADLLDSHLPKGAYQINWFARRDSGVKLPSGLYFCEIRIGKQTQIKKMVLLQ